MTPIEQEIEAWIKEVAPQYDPEDNPGHQIEMADAILGVRYFAKIAHQQGRELQDKVRDDAAEMLWVVLANVSGGDWSKQSVEWQKSAEQWRDNYFMVFRAPPQEKSHCSGCTEGSWDLPEGRTHQMDTIEHPPQEKGQTETTND